MPSDDIAVGIIGFKGQSANESTPSAHTTGSPGSLCWGVRWNDAGGYHGLACWASLSARQLWRIVQQQFHMLADTKSKLALWLPVIAAFAACAGPPRQMYDGDERPRSEIAILKDSSNAKVIAIDGVRTSGTSWALLSETYDIALRVRVYMQAPGMNWTAWTYCWVSMNAAAGEEYTSQVLLQRELENDMREEVTMVIGVIDAAETLVAQSYRCVADRPKFDR